MRLWPFGKLGSWLERKYSAVGPNIARMFVGQAVWMPRRYDSFADEGYAKNAISFRAVKLVATSAAGIPILLYDSKGKEIPNHPLLDLLNRPSGAYSKAEFLEAVYAYFLLAGNSYIEAVGPDRGPPKELWPHRPDRMQVVAGRYGFPEAYRYTVNGIPKDWPVNPLNGDGPILHMKDFNPLDDWYGMSRIEAAAYGIDRHNAASAHNKALLDNGARPSGALVFKPVKLDDGTYSAAPQSMIDAAREKLNDTHVGPEKAGKPFVFSGDVKWEEMGTTPKDMDFNEGKLDAARDILAAIGVPAMLLVPGESTYSNRSEANLELYERTVIPLAELFVAGLNKWLCPRFGEGLRLGLDYDNISALEPRRETRRKSAMELYEAGIIDKEEAREMLQYGPSKPDFVGAPDAQVLTALQSDMTIDTAGLEPLYRYMRKVGLIAPTTTLAKFELLYRQSEGDQDNTEDVLAIIPTSQEGADDENQE